MPVAGLFTWLFRRMSRPLYRAIRMTVSRLNENLQENLSGIEVVQLYGREKINFERYSAINNDNRVNETKALTDRELLRPVHRRHELYRHRGHHLVRRPSGARRRR